VGAVALWLVLEWYGATSEVSWLFLLAAWLLALIVAAGFYALWNRAGLRLELGVESSRPGSESPLYELPEQMIRTSPYQAPVFESDALELTVRLRSSGGARGPAWVSGQAGGKEIRLGTGLVPASGWTRVEVIRGVRRGPVNATAWSIGTSDPLGFFRGLRSRPDSEVALVLPRFATLAGRRQARELEATAAAPRAGSGNELFGIREYRPGDSLRRIHWRSSARHGELVVREYEPPGLETLTILVDPSPSTQDVADQIARIAASEAWDCIREGGRVVIGAPGLERSEAPRDMWSQLEWLARYPNVPSGGFAATSPASGEELARYPDVPSGAFGATSPHGGEELVVITASDDAELLEMAERARRGRVWVVGEAEIDTELPIERVGTQWPL
jgi:uncharacterized protein (DUF58 family)